MMGPYRRDDRADFATAEAFGAALVAQLTAAGWPEDVILNVNFPARPPAEVTKVEITRQGLRDVRTRFAEQRTDLRGRSYYWLGYRHEPSSPPAGTDLRAAYDGAISITPLHIDLTHSPTLEALRAVVSGAAPRSEAPA